MAVVETRALESRHVRSYKDTKERDEPKKEREVSDTRTAWTEHRVGVDTKRDEWATRGVVALVWRISRTGLASGKNGRRQKGKHRSVCLSNASRVGPKGARTR